MGIKTKIGSKSWSLPVFLLGAFPFIWVPAGLIHAAPQDSFSEILTSPLEKEYQKLYQQHCQSLSQIASKCEELGKVELASFTRKWIPVRDPSRDYLFVLPGNRSLQFPRIDDRVGRFWRDNFDKLNRTYAQQLFQLAQNAMEEDQDPFAYRLLHECLFHDPKHEKAGLVLGTGGAGFQVRKNPFRQKDKLLPEGELVKYETDHFQLYTAIDEELACKAIARFERWYVASRQLFYSYWAHETYLNRRFEAKDLPRPSTKKFKVVLYPNREEYLAKLQPVQPGIEVSVGYYRHKNKTSFFYIGNEANETTWIHELTHQFLHETIPVSTRSEIRSAIWAVEGIAMYMESLSDFQVYFTTGGQDAERLNYCRHNFFRSGFFVPMSQLHAMASRDFVESEQVAELYSLSAGYCHYIMDSKSLRPVFFKFLKMVHQGKNSQVFFERLANQISFDDGFKEFLKPEKQKIEKSLVNPTAYKILYLGNSDVDDQTMRLLQNAVGLESLDLSGTGVTDDGLKELARLKDLRYLCLERTRVTDGAVKIIENADKIEELDLTTTAITDEGVSGLTGFPRLTALWIAGTRVSDKSVDPLLRIRSLQQLDIRKTEITEVGRKKLNLQIKLVD